MRQDATGTKFNGILRPPCAKCGTESLLVRIEPDKPGFEQHIFECPKCEHSQSSIFKIGSAASAAGLVHF
jgi:hypothetical protein